MVAALRFRVAAMFYDSLFVFTIWVITLLPLVLLHRQPVHDTAVQFVLGIEVYAYFAGFWVLQRQTIGMRAWHLELVSESEFTWLDALKRLLGAIAALATVGLGYFWMWIDKEKRTWPDAFSGSQLIRSVPPCR